MSIWSPHNSNEDGSAVCSSKEYFFTCLSNTRINLKGPYDSVEAFEKISLSGGSGESKADKLYRRLLKVIDQVKETKEKIVVNAPQLCNHVYFGTRTKRFVIYVCEEKHGIKAAQFKKSEANLSKFSEFILEP